MRFLKAFLLLVPILGTAWLLNSSREADGGGDSKKADRYVVKRGPMKVTITESSSLEAARSVNIRSEIEGRTTILWLEEEGKKVDQGDILVRLDVSSIKDRLETQEISVERAKAAFLSAEKTREIQINQNASAMETARNDLTFAELELRKFDGFPAKGKEKTKEEMGERDQQLVEAQSNIELAIEDLRRARNRLEWTRKLHEKKYVTDMDLEADRISVLKAENQVKLAENRLHILETYTLPKKRRELVAKRKEAEAALERTRLRCEAELAQKIADLNSKKRQYELEKNKLEKLRRQVEAGVLRAPSSGLVVYATVGSRMRQTPIDEGTEVRQGQSIIILPDVSTIRAKASIHESQIDMVKEGQKVALHIDALPDRVFYGHVERVSIVPDSRSSWLNPEIKLYSTWIAFDQDTRMLKPGQSCSIEITVAEFEDVIAIPVQAVQRAGRILYCWVVSDQGPAEPRILETGISNDRFVLIAKGLNEGEVVLLHPPAGRKPPEFEKENEALKRKEGKRTGALAAEAGTRRTEGRNLENGARRGPSSHPAGNRPTRGPVTPVSGNPPSRGRGRGRMSAEARKRFENLLARAREKFPEHADDLSDLRALFRNPDLRAKILADPELSKMAPSFLRSGGRGNRNRRGSGARMNHGGTRFDGRSDRR